MEDLPFKFIQNKITKKWVIAANTRGRRPKASKGLEPTCPFCPGRESNTPREVFRLDLENNRNPIQEGREVEIDDPNWDVRVVPNKFPFAPVHELIIHSPNHKNLIHEMNIHQVEKLVWVYRHRVAAHQGEGTVFLFNNTGNEAGASLPHPHTQLVVIPPKVKLNIDPLGEVENIVWETKHFNVFVPSYSTMPYEVWAAPKLPQERGRGFWEVGDKELFDFSHVLHQLTKAVAKKFSRSSPSNFFIYPGGNWYLRLIPRERIVGGFEFATGVYVNSTPIEDVISFYREELS
jgi:UDPglucose--hexose-1-phosphate uridylyltransferase